MYTCLFSKLVMYQDTVSFSRNLPTYFIRGYILVGTVSQNSGIDLTVPWKTN